MTEVVRDLPHEAGRVADHFRLRGWTTPVMVWRADDGVHINASGVSADTIDAALADLGTDTTWPPVDDPLIEGHVGHILQVARATPEQLAALTQAELRHAVRDLARAFVAYVRRDWESR